MEILRTQLDNGLTVLIREHYTAPVISCWMWYLVGMRNERPGITGASHWVEHMLFKGTERWSRSKADQAISRVGGVFNGMTWYDFTTFYETLPVEHLPLALDIEADRVQHARFDPDDVESERSVIIQERKGKQNSPLFQLGEKVNATAFTTHPYGRQTIGSLHDLETMTRDDLYAHFQTYYQPANAVLSIAGSMAARDILESVEHYFAAIAAGPVVVQPETQEPVQEEERRVLVEGPGQTDYVEIVYHIPAAQEDDFHALTVLNAVLSGGSSFMVGRGSITNHTSRLYRDMVDGEITVDINGSLDPTRDPGLYRLLGTVWPGKHPRHVEKALDRAIEQVQNTRISDAELQKAQRQAQALFAYSSESITHQAFWMGFTQTFADYRWSVDYLARIAAVTQDDVRRVARTYLASTNRTVGWYLAAEADRSSGEAHHGEGAL